MTRDDRERSASAITGNMVLTSPAALDSTWALEVCSQILQHLRSRISQEFRVTNFAQFRGKSRAGARLFAIGIGQSEYDLLSGRRL